LIKERESSNDLREMKRFVPLFCFLLGSAGAAPAPDDIAGIRWGASPATVQQTLSKRAGVTFDAETASVMTFNGGDFAEQAVESWRFGFTEGKFTKVNIRFVRREGRNEKGKPYNDLVFGGLHELLRKKYGSPKESSDKDHRHSTWTFPSPSVPGAKKEIVLNIRWSGSDPCIDLTYIDIPVRKPNSIAKDEF
jgi:hypothetical protein